LKLEGSVIILDKVDDDNDLVALYKKAELFCLMAQTAHMDLEGFGLVFLEAAAAGLPVVGTRDSGAEDAILSEKNGFLVDSKDIDGFAEAIVKILKNRDLRANMSRASLEFARTSGWDARFEQYADVYKNLAKPKIVYVTNARLPTEKAHGLATVKIAEAFADLGYQTEMIIPARWRKPEDIFKYYGLRHNFKINKLPTLDLLGNPVSKLLEKPFFWLQLFSFSIIAAIYCFFKYSTWRRSRQVPQVVFFSHDHAPLWFLSFFSENIFYDIHHFPEDKFWYHRVLKKSFGLAVQTKWKVGALAENFGIDPKKIVYWPNGTNTRQFKIQKSKFKIREELGLPQDKKIVVYTGQLFDWKGIDTLISTAAELPDADFYIAGGSKEEIKQLMKAQGAEALLNIYFLGQRPHAEIPLWLRAADVLILPNTAKQKVSLYYTSPMKMFEYMASGTPIVASRIPSITEILNDQNAFLAEADNSKSFAEGIRYILKNYNEAQRLGLQAQKDARKYTWAERAKRISDSFKTSQL